MPNVVAIYKLVGMTIWTCLASRYNGSCYLLTGPNFPIEALNVYGLLVSYFVFEPLWRDFVDLTQLRWGMDSHVGQVASEIHMGVN